MRHPIWGICPVCRKERRVSYGIMIIHRRYDSGLGEMVHCEGSGHSPEEITRKAKNEKETV